MCRATLKIDACQFDLSPENGRWTENNFYHLDALNVKDFKRKGVISEAVRYMEMEGCGCDLFTFLSELKGLKNRQSIFFPFLGDTVLL